MAVSECVSLSTEYRLAGDDPGLCFRMDETGCHGTPDFPVAVYLDDVTTDYVNWHWHDEIELGFVTEGAVIVLSLMSDIWDTVDQEPMPLRDACPQ